MTGPGCWVCQWALLLMDTRVLWARGVCVCVYARAQAYQTLCDPMDCSLPGSSVHGILQARTLEWGAISSSRGSPPPREHVHISCFDRWGLAHSAPWEVQGFGG